mmetsp:Transcript_56187/g.176412  ORF Transcript_56187/g.176412 Transcript_56187/m.176412 type:complete len:265 (-) Transcript_56187:1405-2199(-)
MPRLATLSWSLPVRSSKLCWSLECPTATPGSPSRSRLCLPPAAQLLQRPAAPSDSLRGPLSRRSLAPAAMSLLRPKQAPRSSPWMVACLGQPAVRIQCGGANTSCIRRRCPTPCCRRGRTREASRGTRSGRPPGCASYSWQSVHGARRRRRNRNPAPSRTPRARASSVSVRRRAPAREQGHRGKLAARLDSTRLSCRRTTLPPSSHSPRGTHKAERAWDNPGGSAGNTRPACPASRASARRPGRHRSCRARRLWSSRWWWWWCA